MYDKYCINPKWVEFRIDGNPRFPEVVSHHGKVRD